jgi:hypothetical protein
MPTRLRLVGDREREVYGEVKAPLPTSARAIVRADSPPQREQRLKKDNREIRSGSFIVLSLIMGNHINTVVWIGSPLFSLKLRY